MNKVLRISIGGLLLLGGVSSSQGKTVFHYNQSPLLSDSVKIARATPKDSVAYNVVLPKLNVEKTRKKKKEIGKEVITSKDIARQMMLDARDYIRYIAGVGLSESASRFGSKGYAIRGVDENRVSISVDGMPQAETETNVVFSSYGLLNSARPQFESEFVKKIEVKKGASSFEHGTGALGGAVDFETKDASSLIQPGHRYGVYAKVGLDQMSDSKIYSLGAAYDWKGFEALALFASRKGHELNNFGKGLKLRRSIFSPVPDPMTMTQQSFLGKIAYRINPVHKVTFSFYTQNKKTNTEVWSMEPSYVLTSDNEPYYYGDDQVLVKRWDLKYAITPDLSWLHSIDLIANRQISYLDADTRSSLYRPHIDDFVPNYLFAGTRRLLKGITFKDQVFAMKARSKVIDLGKFGYHLLSLNMSYLKHYISDKNLDINYPVNTYENGVRYKGHFYRFGQQLPPDLYLYSFQRPSERDNFSISLMDKSSISDKLKINMGIRFDYFNSKTMDWNENNDFNYLKYLIKNLRTLGMNFDKSDISEMGFTPMFIVNYTLNKYLDFGYKFSTGYRVPTSQERFFQYVSLSPTFFVLANPKLRRETSYNNEFRIASRNSKYIGYDISFYINKYKDYIEPLFGVQKVFLDGQNQNVAYSINENKKSASLWGSDASIELYLQDIFPALSKTGEYKLFMSGSYSKGSFSDGTSMMSVQPPKAILGFDFDTKKETAGISIRTNFLKAKNVEDTKFVESFYGDETLSRFPYNFFQNTVTVDLFGYLKITKYMTLRASIFNLTNQKYWLWDDMRQLITPIMLVQHKEFFHLGPNSMLRFTQPKRYVNVSLEINI